MTPPIPRMDISSLGLGPELGSGGQGKVTAVDGLLINGQWPAVLKTYSPEAARDLDGAVLEAMVGFPSQLSPTDAGWLHDNAAWPAVVVESWGRPCGFLMRAVPQEYHFGFQTRTKGVQRRLADVAFLLNSDDYVGGSGLSLSDRDRLGLLSSLAAALCRLHAMQVVVGDLSPKNLLFSLAVDPSCFLIDCDAAQIAGQTVLKQVETPDWEVPPGEPTATTAADAYKFALLAVRLFARDQSSRDPAALAAVSPELGRLAEASLYRGAHYRPGPAEWIPALGAATATVSTARISVPIPPLDFAPNPSPSPGPAPRAAASAPSRRGPVALLGVAAALILVIVAVALGIHASAHPSSSISQGNTGASGALGSSASGQGSGLTATDQAHRVNNLLDGSASSRQTLVSAVQDIDACSDTSDAITSISQVVSERQTQYSDAQSLETNALPNGSDLESNLVSFLRYSLQADQDYLSWAQDQEDCTGAASSDAAYVAGGRASTQAVAAKDSFLDDWNGIASGQRLPTRTATGI
jgi:hypothetical protein